MLFPWQTYHYMNVKGRSDIQQVFGGNCISPDAIEAIARHHSEILHYLFRVRKLTPILQWFEGAIGDTFQVKFLTVFINKFSFYNRSSHITWSCHFQFFLTWFNSAEIQNERGTHSFEITRTPCFSDCLSNFPFQMLSNEVAKFSIL